MKNIIIGIALLFCLTTYAQKTINASDIIRDVKNRKAIKVSNATIIGVLDFTFMEEALPKLSNRKSWWNTGDSKTIEKQITNTISFVNCTFKDDVLAYIPHKKSDYTFIANFEEEVVFKGCTFTQKALFKYSNFEKNTDFSNSKFNNNSTFKYANFNGSITFENTFFKKPATFKYAEFKQFVPFSNSEFNESASFKYTKFNKGVSFKNVQFKEDLNIKYAKISGEFNITNMNVTYSIDSKYTEINGKSFNKYLLNNK